ncbi:substrate-binding domain-containing protein [Pseudactinotalea sp.]|uniref:substrate-binding domain-containing protein n=1 Tax=Pseudactinotalea sp. TaxID=1926260 RepID=UPI003B3A6A92
MDPDRKHIAESRHAFIMREVELRGTVRIGEIAQRLGVNDVTIRRDIIELDRRGQLTRVHGGAVRSDATTKVEAGKLLIGVIVPNISTNCTSIVRGMEVHARSARARLVLGSSHNEVETEQQCVDRMVGLGVSGIVIAPTVRGTTLDAVSRRATSIPVPVVVLERDLSNVLDGNRLDNVRVDRNHGVALALRHFQRLGHDAVALAIYDSVLVADQIRDGFHGAAAHLGLTHEIDVSLPYASERSEDLTGAIEKLLARCAESGTTALLVHAEGHAGRIVDVALNLGIRIPEDLAIVSYDDIHADLAAVPLTSVSHPNAELGREALTLLVDRIDDVRTSSTPRHIMLLPELTIRSSCAAAVA